MTNRLTRCQVTLTVVVTGVEENGTDNLTVGCRVVIGPTLNNHNTFCKCNVEYYGHMVLKGYLRLTWWRRNGRCRWVMSVLFLLTVTNPIVIQSGMLEHMVPEDHGGDGRGGVSGWWQRWR